MNARGSVPGRPTMANPFLAVVDIELPGKDEQRNEIGARKTFDSARSLAVATRKLFDDFFGDDADYFVMRVVDLRDYRILFEYY